MVRFALEIHLERGKFSSFSQLTYSLYAAALFIQDFPLITSPDKEISNPRNNPKHSPRFSLPLFDLLHQLGVPQMFKIPFLHHDFSASNEIRLVISKAGLWAKNDGTMSEGGGLVGLAEAVASLGFEKGGKWLVEGTGSSIGSYSNKWLSQFLGAAQGINPLTYFNKTTHSPPSLGPLPATTGAIWNAPIKIIYPTLKEIDDSYLGRNVSVQIYFDGQSITDFDFISFHFSVCLSSIGRWYTFLSAQALEIKQLPSAPVLQRTEQAS